MRTCWLLVVTLASQFSIVDTGWPADDKEPTIDKATLDLTVPESPAFTVLGLTPENVVRPANPRELAMELLNGVDRNGNLQSGVAIDTAPYLLAKSRTLTLRDYQADRVKHVLARTQLSFATAKGTDSEDEAIRAGVGLRVTPWDEGDPRLDPILVSEVLAIQGKVRAALAGPARSPWEERIVVTAFDGDEKGTHWTRLRDVSVDERAQKLHRAAHAGVAFVVDDICRNHPRKVLMPTELDVSPDDLFTILNESREKLCELDDDRRAARVQALVENSPQAQELATRLGDAVTTKVETTIVKALQKATLDVDAAREAAKKRNWNASAWDLGAAPSWISTDGAVDDLTSQGGALWTSLAVDFADVPGLKDVLSPYVMDHSQTILHLRYRFDQQVPDPDSSGNFCKQDDLLVGGRLRIGHERFAL